MHCARYTWRPRVASASPAPSPQPPRNAAPSTTTTRRREDRTRKAVIEAARLYAPLRRLSNGRGSVRGGQRAKTCARGAEVDDARRHQTRPALDELGALLGEGGHRLVGEQRRVRLTQRHAKAGD